MVLHDHTLSIGESWLWIIPAIVSVILVGLCLCGFRLPKNRRLAFVSIVSVGIVTVLIIQSIRNWNADETFLVDRWVSDSNGLDTSRNCLVFRRTELLWMTDWGHTGNDDAIPETKSSETKLSWLQETANLSLKPKDVSFDYWVVAGRSGSVGGANFHRTVLIYVNTIPVLLLVAVPPVFWVLTRKRRLRLTRSMQNLCVNCGYSLKGHEPGQRCPECGTSNPIPPSIR